ncbi:MAG: hypothetical protein ABIP61_12300, partial [Burkholderiaceae bacterium]
MTESTAGADAIDAPGVVDGMAGVDFAIGAYGLGSSESGSPSGDLGSVERSVSDAAADKARASAVAGPVVCSFDAGAGTCRG